MFYAGHAANMSINYDVMSVIQDANVYNLQNGCQIFSFTILNVAASFSLELNNVYGSHQRILAYAVMPLQ